MEIYTINSHDYETDESYTIQSHKTIEGANEAIKNFVKGYIGEEEDKYKVSYCTTPQFPEGTFAFALIRDKKDNLLFRYYIKPTQVFD